MSKTITVGETEYELIPVWEVENAINGHDPYLSTQRQVRYDYEEKPIAAYVLMPKDDSDA